MQGQGLCRAGYVHKQQFLKPKHKKIQKLSIQQDQSQEKTSCIGCKEKVYYLPCGLEPGRQPDWLPCCRQWVLASKRRNGRTSGRARGRAERDNLRRRRSLGSHRRCRPQRPQTLARRGTVRRRARCKRRRQHVDGGGVGPARAMARATLRATTSCHPQRWRPCPASVRVIEVVVVLQGDTTSCRPQRRWPARLRP